MLRARLARTRILSKPSFCLVASGRSCKACAETNGLVSSFAGSWAKVPCSDHMEAAF